MNIGGELICHYFYVGREVWGMAALELEVVELMAKHTVAQLPGLVEGIRGLANPKSRGARREVHLHPQPCLKWRCRGYLNEYQ